jgi:DNA invertase Pin-like site-specific DNA recombinase
MKWTVVARYVDHDSGGKADRPAFKKMSDAASRREFDVVRFWALDRFSREGVLTTLTYLQRLDQLGIGWRSFSEQYLDSCGVFKDAVMSILATIAKQERIRLSERVKAGLDRAKREGKVLGRRQVWTEAQARKAMKLSGQGKSIRYIAAELGLSHGTAQRLAAAAHQ